MSPRTCKRTDYSRKLVLMNLNDPTVQLFFFIFALNPPEHRFPPSSQATVRSPHSSFPRQDSYILAMVCEDKDRVTMNVILSNL